MKITKAVILAPFAALLLMGATNTDGSEGCSGPQRADTKMAIAQAKSLNEANSQIGMPEIINFQEKRMMKTLYELRDQSIATHSYIVNNMQGCLVYLGPSVGYGMPYATQYSAPHVPHNASYEAGYAGEDQAEPNGLFMPPEAHGTWVMLKDPNGDATKPVYIEPDVIVSPFRLTARECR